jgi:poly-beta-1,6-N-acetyl-D-glucosamine synthase
MCIKMNEPKFIVVSPVRNEDRYLAKNIQCIIDQTVRPKKYLLVDDGSTDETSEIIKNAARNYPWIHYVRCNDRGERQVGPGVVEAFYSGYAAASTDEYDFICKTDGDLTFGPRYFEVLFQKFDNDPCLGSASGKLYLDTDSGHLNEERISDESVLGGMLCLRRKCFEDIGGFVQEVMWDGIVFHRARMAGWRTRSFHDQELIIHHHRLMGSSYKSIYHGRLRWGWGQYFMGTHPLYLLAIGLYRMIERPLFVGGILIVLGYLKGWIKNSKRYEYPGFRKSLRAWQFERLRLGHRLEIIPGKPG